MYVSVYNGEVPHLAGPPPLPHPSNLFVIEKLGIGLRIEATII